MSLLPDYLLFTLIFNPRVSEMDSSVSGLGHIHFRKKGFEKKINNRIENSIDSYEAVPFTKAPVLVCRDERVNPSPTEPGYILHLQTVEIRISWLLEKPADLDINRLQLTM